MLTEYRNSVRSILDERTTSPLYGTFIISWLLCNWKIIYLTIFIDGSTLPYRQNKIEYILQNFSSPWYLIVLPLVSTSLLLTAIPWIANKVYELSLYFELERVKHKEAHDGQRRLTIEQSTALRNEMRNQEQLFQQSLASKDTSLQNYQQQLNDFNEDRLSFKFLIVRYGSDQKDWVDLTTFFNSLIDTSPEKTELTLEIVNENLQLPKDPAPGIWKHLHVLYQTNGEIKTLFAREDDTIHISEKTHGIKPGVRSAAWAEWFNSSQGSFDNFLNNYRENLNKKVRTIN